MKATPSGRTRLQKRFDVADMVQILLRNVNTIHLPSAGGHTKNYPYTLDNGHGELLIFTGVTHGPDGDRAEADGVAQPGGRPGIFDAACLITHFRSAYAMLEPPAVVRRIVLPIVYGVGILSGKYKKYRDAPAPIRP